VEIGKKLHYYNNNYIFAANGETELLNLSSNFFAPTFCSFSQGFALPEQKVGAKP